MEYYVVEEIATGDDEPICTDAAVSRVAGRVALALTTGRDPRAAPRRAIGLLSPAKARTLAAALLLAAESAERDADDGRRHAAAGRRTARDADAPADADGRGKTPGGY